MSTLHRILVCLFVCLFVCLNVRMFIGFPPARETSQDDQDESCVRKRTRMRCRVDIRHPLFIWCHWRYRALSVSAQACGCIFQITFSAFAGAKVYKDAVQGGHPPPPIIYLVPLA